MDVNIPINASDFRLMLDKSIYKKYCEYWGAENSEDLKRFAVTSYVNKPIIEYCKSRAIPIKNKVVLEFGCRLGSSFFSWLYMGCERIVGMDIDEQGLALSNEIFTNLGHRNISYRLNQKDEPLPLKANEFDIVSCNAIIEHLPLHLRKSYLNQLSLSVKKGGYLIVSDTPNRLWLREGHTTGLWFINYLPFRLKCFFGSMTKRWKGKIRFNEYDKWTDQGLQGSSYKEIFNSLSTGSWEIQHDIPIKAEYKNEIIGSTKKRLKLLFKMPLVFFAFIQAGYFKLAHGYPSSAVCPSLLVSFKKIS